MVTGQDFFMNRRDFHDGRSRFFFASLMLINLMRTRGDSKTSPSCFWF